MDISMFGQILVNGVLSGMTYVLMAIGFTLIFGIMRVVNFAHGEFYMVGAFGVYVLAGLFGMNFFLAVVLAALFMAGLSFFLERILFRPLEGLELNSMIMALAVGIALKSISLFIFGPIEVNVERPVSGGLPPWGGPVSVLMHDGLLGHRLGR